jgi:hypothetical protein
MPLLTEKAHFKFFLLFFSISDAKIQPTKEDVKLLIGANSDLFIL